jgi:hypothetical protein
MKGGYRVLKRELLTGLQVLVQEGLLRIPWRLTARATKLTLSCATEGPRGRHAAGAT